MLFAVFVISTICLGISYTITFPTDQFFSILDKTIFYLGFFGYITVASILCFNYMSGMFKWFKEKNSRVIVAVVIILGFGYSLFDGLKEESWLVFFRDVCMAGLVIVGLPFVDKIISKLKGIKKGKK